VCPSEPMTRCRIGPRTIEVRSKSQVCARSAAAGPALAPCQSMHAFNTSRASSIDPDGDPPEECGEVGADFGFGEGHAQAVVDAGSEGEVLVGFAVKDELVGPLEVVGISVARSGDDHDDVPAQDLATTEFEVCDGS